MSTFISCLLGYNNFLIRNKEIICQLCTLLIQNINSWNITSTLYRKIVYHSCLTGDLRDIDLFLMVQFGPIMIPNNKKGGGAFTSAQVSHYHILLQQHKLTFNSIHYALFILFVWQGGNIRMLKIMVSIICLLKL